MTVQQMVLAAVFAAAPGWAAAQQSGSGTGQTRPPGQGPPPPGWVRPEGEPFRAAPPPSRGPVPDLLAGVELSPEQEARLRAHWAQLYPQWAAVVARQGPNTVPAGEDQATLRDLAARQMAAVVAELTPAQRETFDRNVAARRAHFASLGGGRVRP